MTYERSLRTCQRYIADGGGKSTVANLAAGFYDVNGCMRLPMMENGSAGRDPAGVSTDRGGTDPVQLRGLRRPRCAEQKMLRSLPEIQQTNDHHGTGSTASYAVRFAASFEAMILQARTSKNKKFLLELV